MSLRRKGTRGTKTPQRSADRTNATDGDAIRHRILLDAEKEIVFSFVFSADVQ
jgi:hypothetical protein